MDYFEFDIKIFPHQPGTDLLISELSENGFESFVETQNGFLAYIATKEFKESLLSSFEKFGKVEFSKKLIPAQNWNAEWEKNYEPIFIAKKLMVRAPFHEQKSEFEIDIVIQAQQSFGTGHHETTRLMAEKLLTMNLSKRYVMDMGCGTGVLAILSNKLGAAHVIGIDIETNSVMNAKENCLLNKVVDVEIEEGTENQIGQRKFDILLANINKNILLQAMKIYAAALNPSGELLLSGFFVTDVDELKNEATKNSLDFFEMKSDGEWALLHFIKGN